MMLGPDYWKLGALNIKVEPEDLIVNKPDCLKRPGLFFFPSGTADHALRLGPYMRRSYY